MAKLEAFVERALDWADDAKIAVAVGADGERGAQLLSKVEALFEDLRTRPR